MKIPKSFKLMGQTITVTRNERDFAECPDRIAFACYRLNEIQINPIIQQTKTQEQIEHAFFHELTHFIIYHSECANQGKTEYMHQDEGFIDLTANLLHQVFTTMEYES